MPEAPRKRGSTGEEPILGEITLSGGQKIHPGRILRFLAGFFMLLYVTPFVFHELMERLIGIGVGLLLIDVKLFAKGLSAYKKAKND